jgi:DNA-binding XRE family transcriptional regulator
MRPRIRELRHLQQPRMSQQALAVAAGVAVRTVQHFEAGTKQPQLATMRKIAGALGVGLEDLFTDAA